MILRCFICSWNLTVLLGKPGLVEAEFISSEAQAVPLVVTGAVCIFL